LHPLHRQHLQRLRQVGQRVAHRLLCLVLVVFLPSVERALEAADVTALAIVATVHRG
jgi:hypothetical protein